MATNFGLISKRSKIRMSCVGQTHLRLRVSNKQEERLDDELSAEVIDTKKKVRKAKTETEADDAVLDDSKPSRTVSIKREAPPDDKSSVEEVNKKKKARQVKMETQVDNAADDDDSTLSAVNGDDVEEEAEDDEPYVEAGVAYMLDPPLQEVENWGNESIRNWFQTLGIQSAYGMGIEGLSRISDNEYVPPEKRRGINVRPKLRALEKSGDLTVAWHRKNAQWIPPIKAALHTMVEVVSEC
eukprot:scaffold10212_cov127-Amphora_coffeaeformis.AAC.3